MEKQNSDKAGRYIKNPGALLLIWAIASCIVAIYLYVKWGGKGQSTFDGFIIFGMAGIMFYPVVRILLPSLKKEGENLLAHKLEHLIQKGKYEKAKKVLERHESSFHDSERICIIRDKIKEYND